MNDAPDFDLIVFIGRFQIFHMRHLACVLEALRRGKRVVILFGSANAARSFRNPFTFEERMAYFLASMADAGQDPDRVICLPLEDTIYDDNTWKKNVLSSVASVGGEKIAIIGYEKDHTGYFLRMFPEWKRISVNGDNTSSSYMRNAYFSNIGHLWTGNADGHKVGDSDKDKIIPTPMRNFLMKFMDTPEYKELYKEREFITEWKKPYFSLPRQPTFISADAVITHGKKVLLVPHKGRPGMGLLSLPGELVSHTQTIFQAIQTKLAYHNFLIENVSKTRVFDNPERDARGHIVSYCYNVKLNGRTKVPELTGNASWWPIEEVFRHQTFGDHYDIINEFLGEKNG